MAWPNRKEALAKAAETLGSLPLYMVLDCPPLKGPSLKYFINLGPAKEL